LEKKRYSRFIKRMKSAEGNYYTYLFRIAGPDEKKTYVQNIVAGKKKLIRNKETIIQIYDTLGSTFVSNISNNGVNEDPLEALDGSDGMQQDSVNNEYKEMGDRRRTSAARELESINEEDEKSWMIEEADYLDVEEEDSDDDGDTHEAADMDMEEEEADDSVNKEDENSPEMKSVTELTPVEEYELTKGYALRLPIPDPRKYSATSKEDITSERDKVEHPERTKDYLESESLHSGIAEYDECYTHVVDDIERLADEKDDTELLFCTFCSPLRGHGVQKRNRNKPYVRPTQQQREEYRQHLRETRLTTKRRRRYCMLFAGGALHQCGVELTNPQHSEVKDCCFDKNRQMVLDHWELYMRFCKEVTDKYAPPRMGAWKSIMPGKFHDRDYPFQTWGVLSNSMRTSDFALMKNIRPVFHGNNGTFSPSTVLQMDPEELSTALYSSGMQYKCADNMLVAAELIQE